ncbi:MAG TPA: OPT/YSL family transporter, partial [Candidatus Limnocylindria bacterium]|nr:OPT/YSL family transporter [Candidatus Limnocylindria bacterium]
GLVLEACALFAASMLFLTYFNFSFTTQIYLLFFTFVCAYQMTMIGGKIGLAQLGRFATFVMVPAMFLFKLDFVQLVIIATFVELCGGVATDALFGRKIAHMGNFSHRRFKMYQYLGLAISAISIGAIFWFLINHFGLGSPELFAGRAQSRKLLIDVQSFDYYILILGAVFGYLLKFIKVSPLMVLGGLLMPLNISMGLMLGGACTLLTKDKEEWYPFWSGVFASNSIWMLLKAIF